MRMQKPLDFRAMWGGANKEATTRLSLLFITFNGELDGDREKRVPLYGKDLLQQESGTGPQSERNEEYRRRLVV